MTAEATEAILTIGVTRTFTSSVGLLRRRTTEVQALRGLDLTVPLGQAFGLVGPNGAGKTTLVKILSTILLPTSGRVEVLGHDVVSKACRVREQIAAVFGGERGFYGRLTGRENLSYFGELNQLHGARGRGRVQEVLRLVGLGDDADRRVETYSRGMLQRLHIARGLLTQPAVLFLDEPTVGLDPVVARELRQIILQMKGEGITVVVTSHYMAELELLCDRVAVMNRGRIIRDGTPSTLKSAGPDGDVVDLGILGDADAAVRVASSLRAVLTCAIVSLEGRVHLHVRTASPAQLVVSELVAALQPFGVTSVVTRPATLEDAYVYVIAEDGRSCGSAGDSVAAP